MAARYDVAPKTTSQLTVAVEVRQLYSTEMEETVAMAEINKKSHVIDLHIQMLQKPALVSRLGLCLVLILD